MFQTLTQQSFNVLWRSALVRLPRYVPTQVLYYTDPEGPYPIIIDLPSRGQYKIPVYAFIKRDLTPCEAESLPVVLDFHGGGFVLGSCLEQAPFCSRMARELGAVVISVDYRMGPVSKFPAAIEDAEDVLEAILDPSSPAGVALREAVRMKVRENWAALSKEERKKLRKQAKKEKKVLKKAGLTPEAAYESRNPSPAPSKASSQLSSTDATPLSVDLDPCRIAISGFSSGGNLALNLGLSILSPPHEESWPSVFDSSYKAPIPLLLYYPSFDSRQLPSERTLPKDLPPGTGFWSETADVLAPSYLPREKAHHPRASPGLADIDGLHDMARMLLVLPGLDSLAHQSEIWVDKVEKHRRREHLQIERYPDMKHGWTQMPDGWLSDREKEAKNDIYAKTIDFTRMYWEQGRKTSDTLNV
jgi:ergosteryl-3beta-O-L-aspartate hydrolase